MKLSATKKYTGLRDRPYHNEISFDRELYQILYECMDLYSKGLVNFNDEAALNFTYVHPKQMSVHALGGDIFWMMSLINIPNEDLEPIVKQLSM